MTLLPRAPILLAVLLGCALVESVTAALPGLSPAALVLLLVGACLRDFGRCGTGL